MEFRNNIIKIFVILAWIFPSQITIAQSGADRVRMLVNSLENDSDFKVRVAAAQALGEIADGTVADWMVRAFRHDQNDAVRLTILYAISNIPDERIVPPLIELANQEVLSPKEKILIEQILWNFRSIFNTSAWIADALNSRDMATKKAAIWVLGIIGDNNLVPIFQKLSSYPMEDIQAESFSSLAKSGDQNALDFCNEQLSLQSVPMVQRAARFCVQSNQLLIKNPSASSFRKKMKVSIDGLKQKSIKPSHYLAYLNKNLNQREVDIAVSFLQPQPNANKAETTVKLFEIEKSKTFQLVVDMKSKYQFSPRDMEVLRSIIAENSNGIDVCYNQELKNSPTMRGDVVTYFKILGNGRIDQAKITGSSLKNKSVENCILGEMKLFEFPKLPIDFVDLVYTFTFVPPAKTTVTFH